VAGRCREKEKKDGGGGKRGKEGGKALGGMDVRGCNVGGGRESKN